MASQLEKDLRAAIPPARRLGRQLRKVNAPTGQQVQDTADNLGEQVALDLARAGGV